MRIPKNYKGKYFGQNSLFLPMLILDPMFFIRNLVLWDRLITMKCHISLMLYRQVRGSPSFVFSGKVLIVHVFMFVQFVRTNSHKYNTKFWVVKFGVCLGLAHSKFHHHLCTLRTKTVDDNETSRKLLLNVKDVVWRPMNLVTHCCVQNTVRSDVVNYSLIILSFVPYFEFSIQSFGFFSMMLVLELYPSHFCQRLIPPPHHFTLLLVIIYPPPL